MNDPRGTAQLGPDTISDHAPTGATGTLPNVQEVALCLTTGLLGGLVCVTVTFQILLPVVTTGAVALGFRG